MEKNIVLAGVAKFEIEAVASALGISVTELMTNAVSLYIYAYREFSKNKKLKFAVLDENELPVRIMQVPGLK